MRLDCNYITIHVYDNKYFDNLTLFVKEHFDTVENKNSVIVIADFIENPVSYYRKLYPYKKIIFYNWEQMVSNNTYFDIEKMVENIKGVDELWDYDELNKEFFSWYGVNVNKVIPIRYTESIKCIENVKEPEIDILLFGFINDLRLEKLKHIFPPLYHDYSFMIISGMDREEQKKHIANSKIILNLHGMQPYCRQEQERIGFCLNNGKCVLSEKSQINYFGDAIIEEDVQNIPFVIQYLIDNNAWKEVAEKGSKMFKENKCNIIRNEV
jgi:hypothetical protein